MESLSYAFEGRGLLFTDDTDLQFDASRNVSYQFLGSSTDEKMDNPLESVLSNSSITFNSLVEFSTRFSSSTDDTNDEKLLAPMEPNINEFSLEASVSAKRARITNLQPQVPSCIVYGCNKDLSSSKDYYKRHKVCDVHSKTALVIVNGIEQRFCQQCSRFHVLSEFDEGKRSCRKRLAGHNQRRRKPQFNPHLGSTYLTMNAAKTSLLFSGLLPSGFFALKCDEPSVCAKCLKLEDDPSQLALPMRYGPKSVLCLHSTRNQQQPTKDYLDAPLSKSSCALSLLSSQSHNSSINSAGTSRAHHPPITAQNSIQLSTLHTEPLGKSPSQSLCFTPSGAVNKGVPAVSHPSTSFGGVNTVNLLELSLHLQRVEQQKCYDGQIKPETSTPLPEL